MNRILRSIIVPSLAVVGVLVSLPAIAQADERGAPSHVSQERGRIERGERDRGERERLERVRFERERIERERVARIERERIERDREHRVVCERSYESGAPAWRLREMGCYVR